VARRVFGLGSHIDHDHVTAPESSFEFGARDGRQLVPIAQVLGGEPLDLRVMFARGIAHQRVLAAKALANGRRAEIVDVLAKGERSVEEIAAEIDQSVANTSQHLQQLPGSGCGCRRAVSPRGPESL
jgi:hypothetical protein